MKPTITIDHFLSADIRLGTVTKAEIPEESRSLIKLTVTFGKEIGERTIFAGIKAWYQPEDLIGRQLPFIINLKPKTMGSLGQSQGMLFAAAPEIEGQKQAVLIDPDTRVPDGTPVI